MPAETAASVNQTASQSVNCFCCEATSAAKIAVTPIATCPQPGTAVKEDARSIASRMKRRLSIARSCRAGGSSVSGFWKGTTAMSRAKYTATALLSSALQGKATAAGVKRADRRGCERRKKEDAATVA